MQIKISAVIITLNEEKQIKRCLESIKDIADEIIIVDSFSIDKTREICEQYNAKFIHHKFEGHIQQKNWALEQAAYDYVLSLDADEELSEKLATSIKYCKLAWEYDGYTFNRLNNYCGKWIYHSGWYPDRKLRLFDKKKGSWQGINPHDCFLLKNGSTQKFIKGNLLHYSYNSIKGHIEQLNKFTEIAANEAIKNGKRASLFSIFFKPGWRFFRDYIVNLGFLDGYYGFIVCTINSFSTFIKYIKIKQLNKM